MRGMNLSGGRMMMLRALLVLVIVSCPTLGHAFSFVASSAIDASSDGTAITTPTCATPTGTANNDMLFALLKYPNTTTVTGVPSGWTLRGQENLSGAGAFVEVYSKLAASEGSTHQWTIGAAGRAGVSCYAFRSDFNTSNPIDVVSDTGYIVSNTTVRAASLTTAAVNEAIIFFSIGHSSTDVNTTAPSAPSAFTADVDEHNADSRSWRAVSHLFWSSSGATGDLDGTLSATTTSKHAFAIALNAASATPATNFFRLRVKP